MNGKEQAKWDIQKAGLTSGVQVTDDTIQRFTKGGGSSKEAV